MWLHHTHWVSQICVCRVQTNSQHLNSYNKYMFETIQNRSVAHVDMLRHVGNLLFRTTFGFDIDHVNVRQDLHESQMQITQWTDHSNAIYLAHLLPSLYLRGSIGTIRTSFQLVCQHVLAVRILPCASRLWAWGRAAGRWPVLPFGGW